HASHEILLRYRLRAEGVRIVTNAYFFPEGPADRYAAARYGEVRVGDDGTGLLVRMLGAARQPPYRLGRPAAGLARRRAASASARPCRPGDAEAGRPLPGGLRQEGGRLSGCARLETQRLPGSRQHCQRLRAV